MSQIKVSFRKARSVLREADVLLFRGRSLTSHFIKRAAQGKYSHVGVASAHGSNGGTIWECVEFREWKGGRTVNLERYVNSELEIDVFRPSFKKQSFSYTGTDVEINIQTLNAKMVTNTMRKMTGLPYGWKRIAWILHYKMPLLKYLYNIDSVTDDKGQLVYPVCSTAVSAAFSSCNFDLMHHRSDNFMEPSDVARSPLLSYVFTIVPTKKTL